MAKEKAPEQQDDYTPDLITLTDENGQETTFEVIDQAEMKGKKYLAMVPYIEDTEKAKSEEATMIVMRIDEDAQGEYLDIVDQDEELFAIGKVFEKRLSEYFEIHTDDIKPVS